MRGSASQSGCSGHGGDTSKGSDVQRIASDAMFHFLEEQICEPNSNSKGKWENRDKSWLQKPQQKQEMTPLKIRKAFISLTEEA